MAKHKSVEAKRLTELGRGLYAWSKVLYGDFFNNHVGVADSSAKAAMREIALMDDTYDNRELLRAAAYHCGFSEHEADNLAQWAARGDDLLKYGQSSMRAELADYVRGTWPDVHELADAVEEGNDEVAADWFVEPRPLSNVIIFRRGGDVFTVGLDMDAAEQIAMTCTDLEEPPIGVAMAMMGGDVEHVVCATLDDAAKTVAARVVRFGKEGK